MTEANVLSDAADAKIRMLKDRSQLQMKTFGKNEIIVTPSSDHYRMGFLLSGTAYLVTINLDYQKRIIDYFEVNDMFCNNTLCDLGNNSYYIYAKTKCTVAFMDYREFFREDREAMLVFQEELLISSGRRLFQHIDILSQLTIRNKLLSYLDYCSKRSQCNSFVLPMPLSELADYLSVDRSAMMREIGKMKDEKLLASVGRKITILK